VAAFKFVDAFLPLDGKLAQLFSAQILPAIKRQQILS
jgi:hypothetical protein